MSYDVHLSQRYYDELMQELADKNEAIKFQVKLRDEAREWARHYYRPHVDAAAVKDIDTIAKNLQLMRALADLEDLRKLYAVAMAEIEQRHCTEYLAAHPVGDAIEGPTPPPFVLKTRLVKAGKGEPSFRVDTDNPPPFEPAIGEE